jgi:hypothetical protein
LGGNALVAQIAVRGEAVATRTSAAERPTDDLPEEVLRNAPLGDFGPYDPRKFCADVVRMRDPDALARAGDRPELNLVPFAAAMGVRSSAAASVKMLLYPTLVDMRGKTPGILRLSLRLQNYRQKTVRCRERRRNLSELYV